MQYKGFRFHNRLDILMQNTVMQSASTAPCFYSMKSAVEEYAHTNSDILV